MNSKGLLLSLFLGWSTVSPTSSPAEEIVAKVGAEEIRLKELQMIMQRLHWRFGESSPSELLQPLIDRKIMKIEAEAKALAVDSLVVATLEQFAAQLLVEGLYDEQATNKAAVTDVDLRDYYFEQQLDQKLEKRASHIAVPTEEEAWKLYQDLQAGAVFAQLATRASMDTLSAPKGGDMGFWQEEDRRRSPFAEQLFTLDEGEISTPYQDRHGNYHLIQATEVKPVGFERQKKTIEQILLRQNKNQLWQAYLDEQLNNFHFTVEQNTLAFLMRQGRNSSDGIPPVAPEHLGLVLCHYDHGQLALDEYLIFLRRTASNRRPSPVDSTDLVQFVRRQVLQTKILPQIAKKHGLHQREAYRLKLARKREEVLIDRLRRLVAEAKVLNNDALKSYYENNPAFFTEPPLTIVEGAILASPRDAQNVAERVRAGADLQEIMRAYPLFMGSLRKYDIFTFSPADSTVQKDAIHEAAWGMKGDEVRGPIKIRFAKNYTGFVVLKVVEKRPARLMSFATSKVQQVVRRKLKGERSREIELIFEDYIKNLRRIYAPQVVIDSQLLNSVSTN